MRFVKQQALITETKLFPSAWGSDIDPLGYSMVFSAFLASLRSLPAHPGQAGVKPFLTLLSV